MLELILQPVCLKRLYCGHRLRSEYISLLWDFHRKCLCVIYWFHVKGLLLPESYLLGAPEAVFHNPFGQGSFGPEILEEYLSTYRDPAVWLAN